MSVTLYPTPKGVYVLRVMGSRFLGGYREDRVLLVHRNVSSKGVRFFPNGYGGYLARFHNRSLSLSIQVSRVSRFRFRNVQGFPILRSYPTSRFPKDFVGGRPRPVSVMSMRVNGVYLLVFFFFFLYGR